MNAEQPTQVALYTAPDGETSLEVRTDSETVWLSRQQLATLFGRDVKTIGKHVSSARREELEGMAVVAKFATTAADGKVYQTEHYNLDMILSVGLFVTFLSRNRVLEGRSGAIINNNALAAMTLLVAMSDPKEKDLMIALITRMIADGA